MWSPFILGLAERRRSMSSDRGRRSGSEGGPTDAMGRAARRCAVSSRAIAACAREYQLARPRACAREG